MSADSGAMAAYAPRHQTIRAAAPERLRWLDMARTAAIVGMVIYHFSFDLQVFGYLPQGLVSTPGWRLFAQIVAGSFMFLAGVSLFLAHRRRIHWGAFSKRMLKIGLGAVAVTVATYIAFPDAFIFFGILHSIFVASLIGIVFVRLPGVVTLAAAIAVVLVTEFVRAPILDSTWLSWLGLSDRLPTTLDYEPVFPWAAILLAGIAMAKMLYWAGWMRGRHLPQGQSRLWAILAWPGKHSLAIYLIHQPVLYAAVYGYTWLMARGF